MESQLESSPTHSGNSSKSGWMLPLSIFVSALIIGGALVYNTGSKGVANDPRGNNGLANVTDNLNFKPIGAEDHVMGNVNAPVKFIEYSDLECPFCKRFHPVVAKIMEAYPGKIAWVYRHFPLTSLHEKARNESLASECAAELGGNEVFWKYINKIYEITPANDGLDPAQLPKIAVDLGINKAQFESCLKSEKHAAKVDGDYEDAVAAGGEGTPFSIIVDKNGKTYPVNGALPFEQVNAIVKQALGV